MAIRYDTKLNNEIRRIVNNYNAKIRRLEKQDTEYILPQKFDKEALKSLKASVSNRQDLRRRLKELQNFTSRGAEKVITYKGTKLPSYQVKNIKMYQSVIKRRLNKKINYYETTHPTSSGVVQDVTFAQAGERDYLNALAKKRVLLNRDISTLSNIREYENYVNTLRGNARTISDRIWKSNYMDIIMEQGYIYGYNSDKLEEIRNKLNKLTPAQFNKLYNTEATVKQIMFLYKGTKDIGNGLKVEDLEDDIISVFDSLYDNLDEILEEYIE